MQFCLQGGFQIFQGQQRHQTRLLSGSHTMDSLHVGRIFATYSRYTYRLDQENADTLCRRPLCAFCILEPGGSRHPNHILRKVLDKLEEFGMTIIQPKNPPDPSSASGFRCVDVLGGWLFLRIRSHSPRDSGSPSENGFMEPKYLAFRFGDCTPQESSSDVRWARIPSDGKSPFGSIWEYLCDFFQPPKILKI